MCGVLVPFLFTENLCSIKHVYCYLSRMTTYELFHNPFMMLTLDIQYTTIQLTWFLAGVLNVLALVVQVGKEISAIIVNDDYFCL